MPDRVLSTNFPPCDEFVQSSSGIGPVVSRMLLAAVLLLSSQVSPTPLRSAYGVPAPAMSNTRMVVPLEIKATWLNWLRLEPQRQREG